MHVYFGSNVLITGRFSSAESILSLDCTSNMRRLSNQQKTGFSSYFSIQNASLNSTILKGIMTITMKSGYLNMLAIRYNRRMESRGQADKANTGEFNR